ncbi:MAG: acetyl xylan esterase [Verrucomicrobia bacterium]|nr:acetyl xylan esterase [Verrucomicrobiota bacterium]
MSRGTLFLLLACKTGSLALALLGYWPAALGFFFFPDFWMAYNLFVPTAQGICPSLTRFETALPEVWLTIDDGPDPEDTPRILDLLDRHRARATFFLIGERAARTPELVREIVRRGHGVGHHTHTHPAGTLWCASRARLEAELDSASAALAPLAPPLRWFRAPVGIKHFRLARALARRGLVCVDWSLRSGDWISRAPETVRDNVLRKVRPGKIVLMHEGPSVPALLRVRAIELVLEALADRGYRCVIPPPEKLR